MPFTPHLIPWFLGAISYIALLLSVSSELLSLRMLLVFLQSFDFLTILKCCGMYWNGMSTLCWENRILITPIYPRYIK